MLLSAFIHYLRGYLVIRISGRYPERFLNVCAARGILVWDVVRLSDRSIRLKISIRGFRMIPPIAYKTGVCVKILAKCGLPVALHKYRRRKLLLGGIAVFILAVIAVNQFVWDIEVVGNEKLPTNLILKNLEDCGLYIGQARFKINQKQLKNDMLIKMTDLSWLWAEKNGSKIVVNVKEKRPAPEIFDPNDYCSVIAAKDGVIDSMIVRNGMPTVKIGDSVQKSAVLVSGCIASERGIPTRYLQADAEIYARTWYEKTKAFSRIETRREETGRIEKKYRLKLFGLELPLCLNASSSFEEYDLEQADHDLSVFGSYLGITLHTDSYKEVTLHDVRLSQDSVIENGIRDVEEIIDQMTLPDSELLHSNPTYQIIDDDTVEITVIAEYLENIAQKIKMEKPEEPQTAPPEESKEN